MDINTHCILLSRTFSFIDMYQWLHTEMVYLIVVVAIFLGMLFEAAHVPWWLTYVMMAYCLVHVITEFALEIHNCCMYDKNRDRQEQFELMKRNDSETKEPEFAVSFLFAITPQR